MYSLLHHLGFAAAGLGSLGETRWADWLDLAVPYLVLGPAGVALAGAGAGTAHWSVFAVGSIAYANGHGIHLSANSIGNVHPGPVAHLWDEVVGHYLWYSGVALVLISLAAAFGSLPPPRMGRVRTSIVILLSIAVGTTWATNGLEGGTAPLSLAVAGAFLLAAFLLARRGHFSSAAAWIAGWVTVPALLILCIYGLRYGGFPQPSELG
jgi:hypothetical protein